MLKLIRKPKPAIIQHRIIRDAIRRELIPVSKQAEADYQRVVSNWRNKPGFKAAIKVTQKLIEITVLIRRARRIPGTSITTADLWKWIDRTGTKAHIIRPKQARILAFEGGNYQPKTSPSPPRFGGPGRVTGGQPVFTQQVRHPGFPPRKFSEPINKDLRKDFFNAIRRGYRKGNKRI